MPLPASWLDHLFGKLSVTYGAAFMRQYADADPELVKANWAQVLDGATGHSLSYALQYLPSTPPNALQFRDLCRMAPSPQVLAIEAPKAEPADTRRLQQTLEALKAFRESTVSENAAQQCIRQIERIVQTRGGKISTAQAGMVAHCLSMSGTSTSLPIKPLRQQLAAEATQ